MPATVKGTFLRAGEISQEIESFGGFELWVLDLDGSNTVKLQKSTTDGERWTDVSTYTSDQVSVAITDISTTINAKHRLLCATKEAGTLVRYKMTKEEAGSVNAPL